MDDERWAAFQHAAAVKAAELERLAHTTVRPAEAQATLLAKGTEPLATGAPAIVLLRRPQLGYADVAAIIGENPDVTPMIAHSIETEVKYEGYIKRQQGQIAQLQRQSEVPIPEDMDYAPLDRLRMEAREKLARVRPRDLGQAARIPGVSPADIAMLSLELAARRRKKPAED